MIDKLTIGPLTVVHAESGVEVEGSTTSGEASMGTAEMYKVTSKDGHGLTLALIRWATGDQDVRPYGEVNGPISLRNLERGRLRMSMFPTEAGETWMRLSLAQVDPNSPTLWATKIEADIEEISRAAGEDIGTSLREMGARAVGTKEKVLLDTGPGRGYVIVVFERGNVQVPIAAFCLTRVLPLLNQYAGPQMRLL